MSEPQKYFVQKSLWIVNQVCWTCVAVHLSNEYDPVTLTGKYLLASPREIFPTFQRENVGTSLP